MSPSPFDVLAEAATSRVGQRTGFRRNDVLVSAVRGALSRALSRGKTLADLALELGTGSGVVRPTPLLDELCQSALVGETFLFRHPEHFEFLISTALPERLRAVARPLRAWSAGCSSGEEAYCLAACLKAGLPEDRQAEVVGTDLSEASLARARSGRYSRNSLRDSPQLCPTVASVDGSSFEVLERLRRITRFAVHNLLEPADALGRFDFVFCRNVLVYLEPDHAAAVCRRLGEALEPGGYLFFSSLDFDRSPPGFVACGPPQLQCFKKLAPRQSPSRAAPEPKVPQPPPMVRAQAQVTLATTGLPTDWLNAHLSALTQIEQGREHEAEIVLRGLKKRAPSYVAATIELALLQNRAGRRSEARRLSLEALAALGQWAEESLLPGPQALPPSYYRAVVSALLENHGPNPGSKNH